MELADIINNPIALITLILLAIALLTMTVSIVISDTKKLSVKMWQLLLFITIGFIGVLIIRAELNIFKIIFLIYIPIYIILLVINTLINKNKYIGQADIDILNGVISLAIPTCILIAQHEYADIEETYASTTELVNNIHMIDYLSDIIVCFMFGVLIALMIFFIKVAIVDKKWRNLVIIAFVFNVIALGVSIIIRNASPSLLALLITLAASFLCPKLKFDKKLQSIVKKIDPKEIVFKLEEITEESKADGESKNKKVKMPICITFIPAYIYAVGYASLALF